MACLKYNTIIFTRLSRLNFYINGSFITIHEYYTLQNYWTTKITMNDTYWFIFKNKNLNNNIPYYNHKFEVLYSHIGTHNYVKPYWKHIPLHNQSQPSFAKLHTTWWFPRSVPPTVRQTLVCRRFPSSLSPVDSSLVPQSPVCFASTYSQSTIQSNIDLLALI